MAKKRNKIKNMQTQRLLMKIKNSSEQRYFAKLSMHRKNPEDKAVSKRKIANLKSTIEMYTIIFNKAYKQLLKRGVPEETINEYLFYNWECRE